MKIICTFAGSYVTSNNKCLYVRRWIQIRHFSPNWNALFFRNRARGVLHVREARSLESLLQLFENTYEEKRLFLCWSHASG